MSGDVNAASWPVCLAGRCAYCGTQVAGRRPPSRYAPVTCPSHRDLPRLDPLYRPLPDPWRLARRRSEPA